ncbi:Uncharacterised protein [uncultured archaeon]|nr:Uncharacterised protein [uncultured archaeon]
MDFKGVGPVTVNIFLGELRRLWESAALQNQFPDFEAALVKFAIEQRRKKKRQIPD